MRIYSPWARARGRLVMGIMSPQMLSSSVYSLLVTLGVQTHRPRHTPSLIPASRLRGGRMFELWPKQEIGVPKGQRRKWFTPGNLNTRPRKSSFCNKSFPYCKDGGGNRPGTEIPKGKFLHFSLCVDSVHKHLLLVSLKLSELGPSCHHKAVQVICHPLWTRKSWMRFPVALLEF